MKARCPVEQIIGIIKKQGLRVKQLIRPYILARNGERAADVCWHQGISSATFKKYKSKYGGMEPSDAKRLRALGTSKP